MWGKITQYRALLFLIFLAASIRVFWLLTQPVVIENEGAEYARIAENLVRGIGYVGTMGGPQLIFPPLYPILIAALHFPVGDFELSGRLVSLILGICLVIPVYGIASLLYGRRVALMSAFLVAFHPILVGLSTAVYSEGPYTTILLIGVYWSLRVFKLESSKHSVAAGIFLGLAYLIRPEAAVVPVLCVFWMCGVALLRGKGIRKSIYHSALLAVVFAATIAPYVVFLTLRTGTFLTEGKHNVNALIRTRVNSGMSYTHAAFGVSRDLVQEGPLLNPNSFVTRSPFKNLGDVIPFVLKTARSNARSVFRSIVALHFGYPILILLIVIGLFRSPWGLQRAIDDAFLLILVSTFALVILVGAPSVWPRHAFPLLPFLLVWAAKGVEELSDWAEKTISSFGQDLGRLSARAGLAVRLTSPVLLLMVAALGFKSVGDLQGSYGPNDDSKRAGLWLADNVAGSGKRIMDTKLSMAYYAGGIWVPLPFADSDVAMQYIRKTSPAFIVLRGQTRRSWPFVADWLRDGIPDQRAELIYTAGTRPEDQIRIYHWLSRGPDMEPIARPINAVPPRALPVIPPKPRPRVPRGA